MTLSSHMKRKLDPS